MLPCDLSVITVHVSHCWYFLTLIFFNIL